MSGKMEKIPGNSLKTYQKIKSVFAGHPEYTVIHTWIFIWIFILEYIWKIYNHIYLNFWVTVRKLAKARDLSARTETLSTAISLSYFSFHFFLVFSVPSRIEEPECYFLVIKINRFLCTQFIIWKPFKIFQQFVWFIHSLRIVKLNFSRKPRFSFSLSIPGKFDLWNPLNLFHISKELFIPGFWTKVVLPHLIFPTTKIFPLKLPS